jgi:bromodomain-containing factor 1
MASDIAPPQQQHLPHSDNMDTTSQDASYEAPMTNGYVNTTLASSLHLFHQHGPSFFTYQERDLSSPPALTCAYTDSRCSDHPTTSDTMEQDDLQDAPAPSQPAVTETAIDTKVTVPLQADPNPAGPTPIEDVVSGIQPVSDFIPKDASNLSHPTPPPDEPLGTGEADVDMGTPVADASEEVSAPSPPLAVTEPSPVPVPQQSESSLIRAREDDGEDEPAAKRSKIDSDESESFDAPILPPADEPMADAPADETVEQAEVLISETSAEPTAFVAPEPVAESVAEPVAEPVVEPVVEPILESKPATPPAEESVEESVVEPSSMDVEAGTTQADTQAVTQSDVQPETEPETQPESHSESEPQALEEVEPPAQQDEEPSHASAEPMEVSEPAGTITASPIEEKPSTPSAAAETQPPEEDAPEPPKPTYSTVAMTNPQKSSLIDKMKNLKKTKSSGPFLRPVDPVALNIPTYPDIIKSPMDLGTMETKLKEGRYGSVQDFVDDFELIVNNSKQFNGEGHAVTQSAFSMQAYFNRMMETVPTADAIEQPKVQKKRSPSISREKPPRRESRQAAAPASAQVQAPAAPAAPAETYALQSDGTPQIRRQSSINRPTRTIKPPPTREIPYAKPKRKEHQLELRFCEHVIDEIRSPKFGQFNHVFLQPVDPVALNIPHYRQVIKQPMDLGTMSQKLRLGQYGTAAEFKKDFDLMIKNCLTFNPTGNPVRDLGIQLQREFERLWADKDKWERKNQPPSNRASSASGDDESEADDDEEEDEEVDDAQAKIRALQKQLIELQNQVSGMGDKGAKTKKPKTSKSASKKGGGGSSAPKPKAPAKPAPKPKKTRQVTYDEKQEISEAVGKMDDKQVQKLTEIITQNCAKYRDMEEMELEIDDLPNDVQVMLLEYVRKIFGNPNRKKAREPSPDDAAALDDDDFEPERGARAGKRKKHKPMGKKEQQDAINKIQNKLAQFSQAATSGSESPTNSSFNATNVKAETSGDEESEESEEE